MKPLAPGGRALFFQLLGWRLRFYADASLKLLIRRWQIWCLLLLSLSPADMPFAAQIQVLSKPVEYLLSGSDALLAWLGISLLAVAWTSAQADALRGGPPWDYLRSLPHIATLETKLDACLLLIADLPLLLPFIAYEFSRYHANRGFEFDCLLAAALTVQLLLIQQGLLRGARLFAFLTFAISLCALEIHSLESSGIKVAGLLLAGPVSAAGLQTRWRKRIVTDKPGPSRRFAKLSSHYRPLVNLILINLRSLVQHHELSVRLPLLIYLGGIVWFGTIWQQIGLQTPVAIGLLLIGVVPLLLQTASLEITLRSGRKPMQSLYASLGISQQRLLLADLLILEALFAFLVLVPIALLYPIVGIRAALILPLGNIVLAALTWLYALDQTHKPRIMPKLIVSIWFLAMCYWFIPF
ncbi:MULTISPECIES: hypothetical protein [Methylomonas]|uniref:Uncharacterized protein n=2 Tax=Methylomonas TaxID=416 RepID=A0A140E3J6_9GAMM|nr:MULTISPECIES: hypothetical protein [Methylomonas]AMK74970.1 hypothetical protein JT25_000455 [Methylomonas denitrificans]OAI05831.1 hypothetical protein A1342_03490 [Methylomonas methanica]TCV80959.1 hypothetical protein EDE11_1178 [Methylomonas methanica]